MCSWLTIYLTAICSLVIVNASEDFLLSPGTGQKIPFRLISLLTRTAFSSKTVDVDIPDLVYELVENDVLVGRKLNVSIQALTLPLYSNLSITYFSNGKKHDRPPTEIYEKQGGGYTAVFEKSSGTMLSIWGNGIYLKPLENSKFPGVFINIHESLRLEDTIATKPETTKFGQTELEARDEKMLAVRQTGRCTSGMKRLVEIAVAYDNAFCSLHSNSELVASAYVQAAVNEADVIFRRDTCISLSLSHIEAHCNDPKDPYAALSAADTSSTKSPSTQILERFTSIWRKSRKQVHRDLAYFFSGFQDGTNIVGMAYVAATCLDSGYGWVEKGDISTFVHEVGHSLSASHSSEGVMKASSAHGDPVFFSDTSITQIKEFVESYGSNGVSDSSRNSLCLEGSSSGCDATCPGQCTGGQCIALYTTSVPEGLVPCTPVHLIYRCTKLQESKFMLGSDCRSGFDFVLRSSPDMDVFCCLSPEESVSTEVISFEYPFVDLNLNGPDGPRTYSEYIQDPSLVLNRTLIRSELVPSCKLTSTKNPSKSPAPNISPVSMPRPSQPSKIPSSTASPVPSSAATSKSPSPVPSLLPSPAVMLPSPSFAPPSTPSVTCSPFAPSTIPSAVVSELPVTSFSDTYSSYPLPSTPKQSISPSPGSSAETSQTPRISRGPFVLPFPSMPSFPGIPGIPSFSTIDVIPSSVPSTISPLLATRGSPSLTTEMNSVSSCGDAFGAGQTFKCMARNVLRTKSSVRKADIRLQVIQRSGLFTLKVRVGNRVKIHGMAAHINTTDGLDDSNLGPIINYSPNGVSEAVMSTDPFILKVPDGVTTCCGQQLFVYASLRICSANNESVCATTSVLSANTVIRCVHPCHKRETVIPFSASLACPKCVAAQSPGI